MAISKNYAKVEESKYRKAIIGSTIAGVGIAFTMEGFRHYKTDKTSFYSTLIVGAITTIIALVVVSKNEYEFKPEFIDEAGGFPTAEQLEKQNT